MFAGEARRVDGQIDNVIVIKIMDTIFGIEAKRLQNVSVPVLTIYKPNPKTDTGSSVIIPPGGGGTILAVDLKNVANLARDAAYFE